MNHFILLGICFFSIEVLLRSNYILLVQKTLNLSKKAVKLIVNKKVSDHWKEIIIPKYSFIMMIFSLQMLLIFLFVLSIFFLASLFFNDFLGFIFSWYGIFESILFAFIYAYFRKLIVR